MSRAHLAQLVRQNRITAKLAEQRAAVPEELRRLLGTSGQGNGAPQYQGAAASLGTPV